MIGLFIIHQKITLTKTRNANVFTAIGQIKNEELYQEVMYSEFQPFRRNVAFYECKEPPILPLIEQLNFISDKNK